MILGLHNMVESIERYWEDHISADGGLSIVGLDGILLIPVIFALFFFPIATFVMVGSVALVCFAIYEIFHFAKTHETHWFWHR